jgi:hypothetical protein
VGTLKRAVSDASAGDELILTDGTYTGDGTVRASVPEVVFVDKSITIRALNTGQAVLDGENSWRVFYIEVPTGHVCRARTCGMSMHVGCWVSCAAVLLCC